MKFTRLLLFLIAPLAFAAFSVHAGEKPFLAVSGKVLYEDKLDADPGEKWKAAKGKWVAVDGVWRGSEIEADNHGAVIRLQETFSDFVIECEFKFEGARTTSLTINALKGHMARIAITPSSVTIRRDDNDHDGPDKAIVFAVFPVDFEPGTWHKVRLEMVGDTMLGQVDDLVAWGSDPLFEQTKANPGFTAGGQSVELRNLTIREATLNPKWNSVKKTLPKPGANVPAPVDRKKKKTAAATK